MPSRRRWFSVIPVIGIQAGFVLGGAVYIETVFQWPGIGAMLVNAISQRDILLVQGGVLIVAAKLRPCSTSPPTSPRR